MPDPVPDEQQPPLGQPIDSKPEPRRTTPVDEQWWLFGGWPPGITLVLSGMFAIGLIIYSYRRFRGSPYEEDED